MSELLTAAQMRAVEAAAIASGEVTGLELMERAGAGVVEAIFEEWPELGEGSHKAVVLCGPGNNGGDGFVVARLLRSAGWTVEVFLHGDADKLPPDAKVNYERWREMGAVAAIAPDLGLEDLEASVVIDALFGTGLTRPIGGFGLMLLTLQEMVAIGTMCTPDQRHGVSARVVSIDVPSGVCSDSGRVLTREGFRGLPEVAAAASVMADLTVSFHSEKLGHRLAEGVALCGNVRVAEIGLPGSGPPWQARHPDRARQVARLARPIRLGKRANSAAHKFTHGHALILSGPSGKGGAGRLAARGALRIGAGVVTVGCPGEALAENAARLDAIMLAAIHDGDALARVLADRRINALCLGPGLGLDRARELVPVALRAKHAPHVVLDADALTAFEAAPQALFNLLHESCVLTPHAGEFARLFPDIAEKLAASAVTGPAYSKVDACREAAKRAGCVVLYKGADTVIAAPDGRAVINSAAYERAAPWLATAGSGDVLAGFITGLLARGFRPVQATETGAWLHVECALSFGPGLIAEDLPEELPKVFRELDV